MSSCCKVWFRANDDKIRMIWEVIEKLVRVNPYIAYHQLCPSAVAQVRSFRQQCCQWTLVTFLRLLLFYTTHDSQTRTQNDAETFSTHAAAQQCSETIRKFNLFLFIFLECFAMLHRLKCETIFHALFIYTIKMTFVFSSENICRRSSCAKRWIENFALFLVVTVHKWKCFFLQIHFRCSLIQWKFSFSRHCISLLLLLVERKEGRNFCISKKTSRKVKRKMCEGILRFLFAQHPPPPIYRYL